MEICVKISSIRIFALFSPYQSRLYNSLIMHLFTHIAFAASSTVG